jgi:hypothetical protein
VIVGYCFFIQMDWYCDNPWVLCSWHINCFYFQVPRESLLFVIPAFGGVVSWDGEAAPYKESDQSITHQVCYFS